MPPVAPGATVAVPLPAETDGDGVLTVPAVTASETAWATDGHEIAWTQSGALPVAERVSGSVAPVRVGRRAPGSARRRSTPLTGRLRTIGGAAVPGPDLALWRAPTDNDRGIADNKQEGRSDAEAGRCPGSTACTPGSSPSTSAADALTVDDGGRRRRARRPRAADARAGPRTARRCASTPR